MKVSTCLPAAPVRCTDPITLAHRCLCNNAAYALQTRQPRSRPYGSSSAEHPSLHLSGGIRSVGPAYPLRFAQSIQLPSARPANSAPLLALCLPSVSFDAFVSRRFEHPDRPPPTRVYVGGLDAYINSKDRNVASTATRIVETIC